MSIYCLFILLQFVALHRVDFELGQIKREQSVSLINMVILEGDEG